MYEKVNDQDILLVTEKGNNDLKAATGINEDGNRFPIYQNINLIKEITFDFSSLYQIICYTYAESKIKTLKENIIALKK